MKTDDYLLTSFQVPLGVVLRSETSYDGMIDIMDHLHAYVPMNSYQSDGESCFLIT